MIFIYEDMVVCRMSSWCVFIESNGSSLEGGDKRTHISPYFILVDTLLPWVRFPSPFSTPAAIISTQPFSAGFSRNNGRRTEIPHENPAQKSRSKTLEIMGLSKSYMKT